MTPGIAGSPPFPEKAKKGAVVAIASTDNPSVPLAVGTCLIDISALGSVQGAKGHAVQNMHWAGDELWDYSTSSKPGKKAPEELPEWIAKDVNVTDLASSTGDLNLDDEEEEEGGVPLDHGEATSAEKERVDAQEEGKDDITQEEVMAQADVPKMTTKGECTSSFDRVHMTDKMQKSMMLSETLSCMVSTITCLPTPTSPNLALTFLLLNPLSCRI